MRIIIRGATEIEIVLPDGVEPPTVGAGGQAPSRADDAGSPPANPIETGIPVSSESPARPAGERPGAAGNEAHLFPLGASTTPGDAEAPGAAAEARPSVTGPGTSAAKPSTVLADPTVAELIARRDVGPADIGATLAVVGDRVREAVANPPLPVERPIELALTRAEGSWPAMPDFLVRRSKSCGGVEGHASVDTQPRAPGHGGRAAPSADAGEGAGRRPGPHDTESRSLSSDASAAAGAAVVPTRKDGMSGERDTSDPGPREIAI